MGILDSIGQILGGGQKQNPLIDAVMGMVGNQQTGGLGGLVQQFASKGLGDIVNSWVSTGQNLPISAQQIQQGLGKDALSQLAAKANLPTEEIAGQLSKLLPQVVDKLTPNGKVNQAEIMSKGMDLLKGLMK